MIPNRRLDDPELASAMRVEEGRIGLTMLHEFSTWEPFGSMLCRQLNLVGMFLRLWLKAETAVHVFTNPTIARVDWIVIGRDDKMIPRTFETKRTHVTAVADIEIVPPGELLDVCRAITPGAAAYLAIPFWRGDAPFGQFVLGYTGPLPSRYILEKTRSTLNVFRDCLRDLLYNHYAISHFTYLPSFQQPGSTEAAILFCDIRESTKTIEVARMMPRKYTDMVVALVQSLLEYGSRIISVPDLGTIHAFTGDGFMATFGEYLTADREPKARAACALAILTAKLLVEGFDRLSAVAAGHGLGQEGLGVYNEDLELRLGVGLNYGQVTFDLFGVSMDERRQRGFHEFTAVGDYMNFGQRLCSVASQPVATSRIVYRSEALGKTRLTAPIIASRTVAHWCRGCFQDDRAENYRTDFEHKGKGHPMPGFEIETDCLKTESLLNCLAGIHDNRLLEAMRPEIAPDNPDDRPALSEVVTRFAARLDALTSSP